MPGGQHPARDLRADLHEPFGCLQEVHNLHELFLCLVDASHVFELHAASFRRDHDLSLSLVALTWDATATGGTRAEEQQARDQQQREGDITQDIEQRIWLLRLMDLNRDTLACQLLDKACGGTWKTANKLATP